MATLRVDNPLLLQQRPSSPTTSAPTYRRVRRTSSMLTVPGAVHDSSALRQRVHDWLVHPRRLRTGYFEMTQLLVWLSEKARVGTACDIAVSFCGGPTTFSSLKKQVKAAEKHPRMDGRGHVSLEFAADHQ